MKIGATITSALVVGAVAIAACGGSDESSDAPAKTGERKSQAEKPSRAEYVRQLDALCERTDEESEGAERRLDAAADHDDAEAMVDALDEVLAKRDEWMNELDAIPVPPSEQEFHTEYRDGVERGFTLSALLRDAIEAEDVGDVSTYADDIRDISRQQDALLDGHGGFEHCGSDDRASSSR